MINLLVSPQLIINETLLSSITISMNVLIVYSAYKFFCVNRDQCYDNFMDYIVGITVTYEWHANVNNSIWIGTRFVTSMKRKFTFIQVQYRTIIIHPPAAHSLKIKYVISEWRDNDGEIYAISSAMELNVHSFFCDYLEFCCHWNHWGTDLNGKQTNNMIFMHMENLFWE